VAPLPPAAPATDEPAAEHTIVVEQVPSDNMQQAAKVQMVSPPLTAELSNPTSWATA
jgi:hypothetical protein